MIEKEIVGKIRDSFEITDVIKEYVPSLRKSGKDFAGLCPFHSEKAPSFYVSPVKNMFYCFGCKQGGDVFKFLMLVEKLTYQEAVRMLGEKAGIKVAEEDDAKTKERREILAALADASVFYHKYLTDSAEANIAREYLAGRGVKAETLEKFRIGFAPDGNKMFQTASKKYSREILIKSGLAGVSERDGGSYDFMRNRIVFPIFDFSGNVIAFGGRTLRENAGPAYLNTPDSMVYSKSKSLFGILQAKESIIKTEKAVILEGYFDVVLCHQEGVSNTVAPLGTSLTEEHIKFIKRYAGTAVLVFDSDDSGRKAAVRAGEICLMNELNCSVVSLPAGMDPDEYVLANGSGSFESLMAAGVNTVVFKADMASSENNSGKPEDKSRIVREVLATVSKISDSILRHEMLKYVSQRFNVSEVVVSGELSKLLSGQKQGPGAQPERRSAGVIRSVEEEIICLCIKHPELAGFVQEDLLEDERCTTVLPLVKKMADGYKLSEIIDSLEQAVSVWLTALAFERRDYSSPEETLDILLKDLNAKRQEEKRRRLEAQVIPMLDGTTPYDASKIEEYQELTKLLKGTQ